MPPKLSLAIAIEPEPANGNMASIRMSDESLTVLTQSYNPVSFTTEGMRKNDGLAYKVHKGFFIRENKFVAVKKINVFERDTRHQMLNDIKALCDAPNIPGLVSFYGAYHVPESGQISIVLEYVDGGSLADVQAKVGKIPEVVLSKMMAKILRALAFLHREKHMVHRDIKPANILMTIAGEPKITDFGISAFIDSTLAQCNTFLGTVTYMSPERINNLSYSFAADIWSLGLAAVELATGRYPYDASEGPLQLMIHVLQEDTPLPPAGEYSEELRDFVRVCLQKDPLQRPMYASDPTTLKSFMQCCFNPHDKLDEIAIVFAHNYYALLNAGTQRLRDLAPLYSKHSTLRYDGEAAAGRDAIIAKLQSVAQMHAGFKVQHQVVDVHCQPLGEDGSALVNVSGQLVSPAASNKPQLFTELFVLSQIQAGEYYVANQCFRLLK
ncbi:Mitogen-activated protein kinase kinase 1 [Tetrabaena socialis]|uniref:mitogen-activated protein kinase kinase n=1 Tax=Tetrabaena socialis TaxID=47790 RepID=A0A2J7ZSJ8_9CHLO|nr:Mitogen-activated protein kinase kinase 1 [Tetrabaena socialis]|eukprot:PNH03249.1 Mitogen-activated protein kinase kinase 1 [Tetrabaena socialis]